MPAHDYIRASSSKSSINLGVPDDRQRKFLSIPTTTKHIHGFPNAKPAPRRARGQNCSMRHMQNYFQRSCNFPSTLPTLRRTNISARTPTSNGQWAELSIFIEANWRVCNHVAISLAMTCPAQSFITAPKLLTCNAFSRHSFAPLQRTTFSEES